MTRRRIGQGAVAAVVAVAAGVAAPARVATADEREPDPDARPDACARGTRWRGHAVDLDVKDAPLADVFRLLADVGRVNVVVADDVAGKVTIRIKHVPWDQALCTVARSKQLAVSRDGTVYLVTRR